MLKIFLKHNVNNLSSSTRFSSVKLMFGKKCSIFDNAMVPSASVFNAKGKILFAIFSKASEYSSVISLIRSLGSPAIVTGFPK